MGQYHKMWCRRHRAHDSTLVLVAAILTFFSCLASSACVPDVHSGLISDPAILQDEAVIAAFAQVQQNISSLFTNTTSDGFSFAVVSDTFCPGLGYVVLMVYFLGSCLWAKPCPCIQPWPP